MEKIVVDASMLAKLGTLDRSFAMYDEGGRLLAYVTPAKTLECPYDEAEIERRSQETEEYTAEEVFAYLKSL